MAKLILTILAIWPEYPDTGDHCLFLYNFKKQLSMVPPMTTCNTSSPRTNAISDIARAPNRMCTRTHLVMLYLQISPGQKLEENFGKIQIVVVMVLGRREG